MATRTEITCIPMPTGQMAFFMEGKESRMTQSEPLNNLIAIQLVQFGRLCCGTYTCAGSAQGTEFLGGTARKTIHSNNGGQRGVRKESQN